MCPQSSQAAFQICCSKPRVAEDCDDFADFETGKRNNLPRIQVIGLDARMTDKVPEKYRGMTREECREATVEDLKAAGIENFIHVRVDQLKTLQEYNAKLGI